MGSPGAAPKQMAITGGCQCGRTRFEAPQAPTGGNYCHCSMCRRATGSVVAAIGWVPLAGLKWSREPKVFRSSPAATRGFCPDCGSPLYLHYAGEAQVGLMLGAFDDPAPHPPASHYGVEARLPWVDIGQGLPARRTDPDLEARAAGPSG